MGVDICAWCAGADMPAWCDDAEKPIDMGRVSPVQLTLSSKRSRNECAVAKNSNADCNSEL